MPDRDAAIEEFTEAVNGFADPVRRGLAPGPCAPSWALRPRKRATPRWPSTCWSGWRRARRISPTPSAPCRATTRRRRGRSSTTPRRSDQWLPAWRARLAREGRDEATRGGDGGGEPRPDPAQPPGGGGDLGRLTGDFAPFERLVAALAAPSIRRRATWTSPRPPRPRNGDADLLRHLRLRQRARTWARAG
jgi:hypothetical protein